MTGMEAVFVSLEQDHGWERGAARMGTWSEFDGDATLLADEVDRLRGVVQAGEARAQELRDLAEQWLYDGDTDQPINDGYYQLLDLADSLAAAADAPQPEPAREMQGGVRLGDFLDPLSDEPDIPPTAGLRRSALSPAQPADPPTCEHGKMTAHFTTATEHGCISGCPGPSQPADQPAKEQR